MRGSLVVLILAALLAVAVPSRAEGLTDVIYKSFDGDPCVLLLDSAGSYGCRTLSKSGVSGPLELVSNLTLWLEAPPTDSQILVMPLKLYVTPSFIDSLVASKKCQGIVFIQGEGSVDSLPEHPQSDALTVPQNATASSDASAFKWNPNGSGNFHRSIPFPIWKLNAADSKIVAKLALANREKAGAYPLNGAELTAYMHPSRSDNSISCLKHETCKPIGGHSTVTTVSDLSSSKQTILVMSSMDGSSLFQQETPSAASDMSGLVALMAVLDALSVNNSHGLRVSDWADHQVLFAAFDAESFGFLGSKQFIRDLNSSAFKNVTLDKGISHIIEAKQVGSLDASGLFIHSEHKTFASSMKSLSGGLSPNRDVLVELANTDSLGMPPSSLRSFSSLKSAPQSLVLTDHASNYANRYFNSVFDNDRNVNSDLVCAAASLILRAVVSIGKPSVDVSATTVNCSLVDAMLHCLSRNVSCPEALAILPKFEGPVPEWPSHYPSVFDSSRFSLHQRFVHDWLYDRSATLVGKACSVDSPKCQKGELCMRGFCKTSPAQFVDATSPNVKLVVGDIFIYYQIINEHSDEPLWTESDWTPIGFRTFVMANPVYDFAFAALAVLVACGTIAASIVLNAKFTAWFRVIYS